MSAGSDSVVFVGEPGVGKSAVVHGEICHLANRSKRGLLTPEERDKGWQDERVDQAIRLERGDDGILRLSYFPWAYLEEISRWRSLLPLGTIVAGRGPLRLDEQTAQLSGVYTSLAELAQGDRSS